MIETPRIGYQIMARMASGRFPGKVLAPLYGKPMIQWLVEQGRSFGLPVVICATGDPLDDALEEFGRELGVPCARSVDRIDQWLESYELIDATHVISASGDSPFTDRRMVARLISTMREHPTLWHYATGPIPNGYTGIGCAGIAIGKWRWLDARRGDPLLIKMMAGEKPPQHYMPIVAPELNASMSFKTSTADLFDITMSGYGLCIDYPPQLDMANRICEHVGHFPTLPEIEQAMREMRL